MVNDNVNDDTFKAVNVGRQLAKRGRHETGDGDDPHSSSEIVDILTQLSAKIDTLNDAMTGNDVRLNTKIDSLEASLSNKIDAVKAEMEIRIKTVNKEFDQRLQDSMVSMMQQCNEISSNAVKSMKENVDNLQARHESRLDKLERFSLEKDLVVSGIPLENDDNPFGIIGDICAALNCNLHQNDFVSVFRLRSKSTSSKNKRIVPIVVRVQDDWVKQELLSSYFKKKNLNLTDIGFKTAARIFINERLTMANREIFNRASEAKKLNLLHRFYTRRGLVFIHRGEKDPPMCIYHIGELDPILPPNHMRQQHRNLHHSNRPSIKLSAQSSNGSNIGGNGQQSQSLNQSEMDVQQVSKGQPSGNLMETLDAPRSVSN